MDDKEFREFWKWLLDKNDATDWLYSRLNDLKEEWDQMPVCECGHRVTKEERVMSKTRNPNFILKEIIKCANCLKIIEIRDYRESIIERINCGQVMVKDLKILKEEVGLEADHEG